MEHCMKTVREQLLSNTVTAPPDVVNEWTFLLDEKKDKCPAEIRLLKQEDINVEKRSIHDFYTVHLKQEDTLLNLQTRTKFIQMPELLFRQDDDLADQLQNLINMSVEDIIKLYPDPERYRDNPDARLAVANAQYELWDPSGDWYVMHGNFRTEYNDWYSNISETVMILHTYYCGTIAAGKEA